MDPQTEAAPRVPYRTDEQITSAEVTRITGLPRKRVLEAARLGHLVAYRRPLGVGGPVRYSRKSAQALAASMVEPATAQPRPPEAAGSFREGA